MHAHHVVRPSATANSQHESGKIACVSALRKVKQLTKHQHGLLPLLLLASEQLQQQLWQLLFWLPACAAQCQQLRGQLLQLWLPGLSEPGLAAPRKHSSSAAGTPPVSQTPAAAGAADLQWPSLLAPSRGAAASFAAAAGVVVKKKTGEASAGLLVLHAGPAGVWQQGAGGQLAGGAEVGVLPD